MVHLRVLLNIAEGYELIGETQRALGLLDQWRTVRDKLELGMLDSFYYRMRGRVFLRSGADDEAEKAFRQAIEAAVARNAKSEELRSTVHLARCSPGTNVATKRVRWSPKSTTGSPRASTLPV